MSRVFDLVLGVFREPGLVSDLRDKKLPENLPLVIRLAAGEGAALQCALDTTGESAETLVDASVFFLQQVLFAPGADSYRVLGADSDAPQDRLRDNYRWLMKWLHPDRNQDGWEAVYADRVNVAWQNLKTLARRAEFDRLSPSSQMLAPMTATTMRRGVPVVPAPGGPLLSGSTVRRLPMLVLGSLGLVAAAMIGVTYWAQSETQRELSELRRDRVAPGEVLAVRPDADARPTQDFGATKVAASATGAAAQAGLDAIDEVVADKESATAESMVPPIEMAAAIPAAGTPPALPIPEPEPATSAATEAMSVVSIAQLGDEPITMPPTASPPAVPIAALPDKALALPPALIATERAGNTASTQPEATTRPLAPTPLSPAKRPAPVAGALAMPPPRSAAPAVASQHSDKLPLPVVAAAEPAGSPLPPKPSASSRGAKQATPIATPAQRRPDVAPQPGTAAVFAAAPADPATPVTLPAVTRAEPTPAPAATAEPTEAAARAPAIAAAAPALRPAPAQHDAEALVQEFASAYAAGDLARFDRLFAGASPDVAAVRQMRSRFGSTEMRYLEIQQIGWYAEAEQGRVRASYRDTYVPRGRRKAIIESGVIEWIIRVDFGDARIASVARNSGGS